MDIINDNYTGVIGPEEIKFKSWLEKEKEAGLTTFRVSLPIENISCKDGSLSIEYSKINFSREAFFKDLNFANEQIALGKAIVITDL